MRVAIFGSDRSGGSQSEAFVSLCTQLGTELGMRGYIPVVHSNSPKTADIHVVEGLRSVAKDRGARLRIEVHRTLDGGDPFKTDKHIQVKPVPYLEQGESSLLRDARLAPRIGAILASDFTILLGGRRGTARCGEYALALAKPVVTVPSFTGSAADLYKSKYEALYFNNPRVRSKLIDLAGSGTAHPTAADIIDFGEALSGVHTYFLSYSRKNFEEADHIELLLARTGRLVRRDESHLSVHDEIKPRLKEEIAKSDTFLSLWSKESASSDYCNWERDTALELQNEFGRPRRILMIQIDDTQIAEKWRGRRHLIGNKRDNRRAEVLEMMRHEFADEG